MKRIVRFGMVGAMGFVADAGSLALMLRLTSLGPFLARLVSIGLALAITWMLNRNFTFPRSERGMAHEGARYGGIGIGTSILNYLVYTSILILFPWAPPLAAVIVSSAAAALASYLGYSFLVFDR